MIGASHIGCNMSGVGHGTPRVSSPKDRTRWTLIVGNFDGDGKLHNIGSRDCVGCTWHKGKCDISVPFIPQIRMMTVILNEAELLNGIRDVSTSSKQRRKSSMFVKVAFVLGSVVAGAFYSTAPPAKKSNTPNVKCSVFRNALKKKATTTRFTAFSCCSSFNPLIISCLCHPNNRFENIPLFQTSGDPNYTTSAPPMPVDLLDDPNDIY